MRKIRRSLAATLKEFMRPPPAQNPCGSFHRPTTPRHSAISPTNSSVACCTSSPIRPPHRDRTNVAPSGRISIAHFCLSHKSSERERSSRSVGPGCRFGKLPVYVDTQGRAAVKTGLKARRRDLCPQTAAGGILLHRSPSTADRGQPASALALAVQPPLKRRTGG